MTQATDTFLETLSDLIAIPSCSDADGGNEAAVQAYVADQFRSAGARVRTFDATEIDGFLDHPLCYGPDRNYRDRPTVIAEVGPADKPALLVLAHSDTVSMNNDPALWTITEPFVPLIKDNRLYGRGANDDKWGVACLIHILRALQADGVPLRKRLVFASTIDEENGVGNGVLLLHLANLRAEAALYLDGGDHELLMGNLGGSTMDLHPPAGTDHEALVALESRFVDACNRISAERRPLFSGPWQNNEAADRSVTPRLMEEGYIALYFYTLPDEDGGALERQLEGMARDILGDQADQFRVSTHTPWFEPTLLDPGHPFVNLVAGAYAAVRNEPAKVTTVSKQDAFVFRQYGLPTVAYGPGPTRGHGAYHQPDEAIDIDDAMAGFQVAHRAVLDWLGKD
jgi:acetylornithine deacetylase/succinyl-diaminopimelate desuccinylase-like protein